MLPTLTPVFVVSILLVLPFSVFCNICSLSFCQCEDSAVSCHGEGEEGLALSSSSLPSSISSITLSRIRSLTIKNNTFSGQDKLTKVTIEDCEIEDLVSQTWI